MAEILKLLQRNNKPQPSNRYYDASPTSLESTEIDVTLQNIKLHSIGSQQPHRQLIVALQPKTSYKNTTIQPTNLITKLADTDTRVFEENDIRPSKRQYVVGLLWSWIAELAGIPQHKLLVQVTLNKDKELYQMDATLLRTNDEPVQAKSSSARKRLCRYLNHINSQLSYGAYYTDPEKGRVAFRICPTKTREEFGKLLNDSDCFSALVASDFDILKSSLVYHLSKITQVYDFQSSHNEQASRWASELLPLLDQSLAFNELEANHQELRNTKVCERRIEQSEQSYMKEVGTMTRNEGAIETARQKVNLFLQNKIEQRTAKQVAGLRKQLINSDLEGKYNGFMMKQTQSRVNSNDNINVWAQIISKEDPKSNSWHLFSSTTHSELRRQKVTFVYSATKQDANKKEKHNPISRLIVLKAPSNIKSGIKWTPNNSVIKRQSEIMKQLHQSECAQLVKFFSLQNKAASVALGNKDRTINYDDCVLMDYYTYKSVDGFMLMNCQTVSSLSRVSLVSQTAQAVRFMKNVHMTHFDLKSSNILLGKGYFVKVADFGEAHIPITVGAKSKATQLTPAHMEDHCPGYTLPYSAPEVFDKPIDYARVGHKIDVFSYGVLLMELLFDSLPIAMRYSESNNSKLVRALRYRQYRQYILANVQRLYYYFSRTVAEILCCVALRCLDPDPVRRPCIDWLVVVTRKLHIYIH